MTVFSLPFGFGVLHCIRMKFIIERQGDGSVETDPL